MGDVPATGEGPEENVALGMRLSASCFPLSPRIGFVIRPQLKRAVADKNSGKTSLNWFENESTLNLSLGSKLVSSSCFL